MNFCCWWWLFLFASSVRVCCDYSFGWVCGLLWAGNLGRGPLCYRGVVVFRWLSLMDTQRLLQRNEDAKATSYNWGKFTIVFCQSQFQIQLCTLRNQDEVDISWWIVSRLGPLSGAVGPLLSHTAGFCFPPTLPGLQE
ncbi:hypothetical protein V8C26DRAFT_402303 [Trichoderma gracile]